MRTLTELRSIFECAHRGRTELRSISEYAAQSSEAFPNMLHRAQKHFQKWLIQRTETFSNVLDRANASKYNDMVRVVITHCFLMQSSHITGIEQIHIQQEVNISCQPLTS